MTETEWLTDTDGRQLLIIGEVASVRKMRLIAAVCVRQAQLHPDNVDAKLCDDLIEAIADAPRPWEELELELWGRPGTWRFTHILPQTTPDRISMELRKLMTFFPLVQGWRASELILEILGNAFRPVAFDPAWRTSTVVSIARGMYESRDFSAMPILADALQDAGCDSDDILAHCRGDSPHVRGCWVVDLVLGKA
jgi:hypothetical protein